MRTLSMLILVLTTLAAPLAIAAESKIEIFSPADGAKLDAKAHNKLDYNITLGPNANHIHVFVDGKQVALLRDMKSSYALDPMAAGKHEICIKIVDANHTPIGVDRCIKVTTE